MNLKGKHKVGVTPRRVNRTFKAEAGRWLEADGRSAGATAGELGISAFRRLCG
jgi:hypothetical protein